MIIIVIELAPMMGHQNTPSVIETLRTLPHLIQTLEPIATIIGLLTLAILFLTPTRLNRIIPAPLIALVTCTLISVIFFGNIVSDDVIGSILHH